MNPTPHSTDRAIRTIMAPLDPPVRRRSRVGGIILTAVFGFAAGVVGGLLATSLFLPLPSILPAFVVRRNAPPAPVVPAVASVVAAVVDVFVIPRGNDLPALLPFSARTGRGVVLTSDGWVATVRAALPPSPSRANQRPVVVGRDRRILVADRVAFDPISEIAFLHVPDLAGSVVPLRKRTELSMGQPLYLPTTDGGLAPVALAALLASPPSSDDVRSSDVWPSGLAVVPAADAPLGTPVVDASGALVGILASDGYAVPVDTIASALPTLFRSGAVERNALGIAYRDTAEFAHGPGGATDGIVLTRGRDDRGQALPAVGERSPLRGKLTEGDGMLAVGDDPLSGRRLLPEILQEYPIGAAVTLRVRRRGAVSEITVTLATLRGDAFLVTTGAPPRAR